MAKGASTEKALGGLHSTLTKVFTKVLDNYLTTLEASPENGSEEDLVDALVAAAGEPSPAMLSAISKFLKDNEITYDSEELNELSALEERLAQKKRNRPTFDNVTELPLTASGS